MADATSYDALLDACRRGDDAAWEALVRQTQGKVFAVTLQYLRDREEAADVAQEVFVKLYRHIGSARTDGTFLAWLLRMARNASLDRLRRLGARRTSAKLPIEAVAELADPGADPEELGLRSARQVLVHRALGDLSRESREMILLKEIQQLQLTEIAELLAMPLGTVKSRSHRARQELARAVEALDPTLRRSSREAVG